MEDDDEAALRVAPTRTARPVQAEDVGAAPTALGRYRIVGRLGAGAMGTVFDALDTQLQRRIALKVVRSSREDADPSIAAREGRAMAQLSHPAVVPVFDVGVLPAEWGTGTFIAMELVEGTTLSEWLSVPGRSWRQVLEVMTAAARGLAAAHRAGVIHRDFKPSNVLIGVDGRARVADFGIAKLTHDYAAGPAEAPVTAATRDVTHGIAGTPGYMSPEAWRGRGSAASDQFSFCATFYEALFGARPFAMPSEVGLQQHLESIERGVMRPAVEGRRAPSWLRQIITKGLRATARERWVSMDALLAAIDGRTILRRRVVGAVAFGLVAVLAVLIIVVWRRSGDDGARARTAVWRERVLTTRGDLFAAWPSPDQRRLAMSGGGCLVMVALPAGEQVTSDRTLTCELGYVVQAAWNPAGTHLLVMALERDEPYATRYWNVDAETGGYTPHDASLPKRYAYLTENELVTHEHDGQAIEFRRPSGEVTGRCDIPQPFRSVAQVVVQGQQIVVDVTDGSGGHRVMTTTRECASFDTLLDVTGVYQVVLGPDKAMALVKTLQPDGKEVAYLDEKGQPRGAPRPLPAETRLVFGMLADGTLITFHELGAWRLARVAQGREENVARGTSKLISAVSPDGSKFALVERSERGRFLRIQSVHGDATPRLQVKTALRRVRWSPSGARLAGLIAPKSERDPSALALVDESTGATTQLAVDNVGWETDLSWLDDRRLAFESADHTEIRWVDVVDGSTGTLLPTQPPKLEYVVGADRSPTSASLAVYWQRGTEKGQVIVEPDGTAVMARAGGLGNYGHSWRSDGAVLWIWHTQRSIQDFDAASKVLGPPRLLGNEGEFLTNVLPLPDGAALIELQRELNDVALFGPVPDA